MKDVVFAPAGPLAHAFQQQNLRARAALPHQEPRQVGDYGAASKHLQVAIRNSPDRRQQDLYSAKLALIRNK